MWDMAHENAMSAFILSWIAPKGTGRGGLLTFLGVSSGSAAIIFASFYFCTVSWPSAPIPTSKVAIHSTCISSYMCITMPLR